MKHVFRVEMLGGLRFRVGDQAVTRFRTQKTGTLLAYLAYYLHRLHAREELIELLWPESDLEAGRMSLRTALASLRRQLEPPGTAENSVLIADRVHVHLNTETVTSDVDLLETAARTTGRIEDARERAAALAEAVELYRGPLMPGFYDDWVLRERERIQGLFVDMLRRLVTTLEETGEPARAIEYAHRVVGVDPLMEEAHGDLMRLYAATGRHSAVARQYREMERLFREELGVAPTASSRALRDRLLAEKGREKPVAVSPSPVVTTPEQAVVLIRPAAPPPPPMTAHLPLTLTRFFGREEEITRLTCLLQPDAGTQEGERLVTLTGPGGSGKTRLALEVARRLQEAYVGAVWQVALADITDPALVPGVIARALDAAHAGEREPLDCLRDLLAGRPALLILDNYEQLLPVDGRDDACGNAANGAQVVLHLLERIPTLTCLITSRQRLGIGGEREFPVPPLPVPAMPGSPERMAEFASVRLFVDRAQAARPDFQVTRDNVAAIAALCERLEGIPLALELAAAWAQMLTPARMLDRLSARFDLLTSRRRDLAPRHRTLRAAIEWSYRLLPTDLQALFARLSVFRGGWTLEAAEEICSEEEAISETPEQRVALGIADAIPLLQERSLIVAEEAGDEMRFRMLETLREYASEQHEPTMREALEARHAAYFVRLAEEAEPYLRGGPEQVRWLERMELELDNFRAALRRCQRRGDTEMGLRLAGAMMEFWQIGGHGIEGRRWLDTFLPHGSNAPLPVRARALLAAGVLLNLHRNDAEVITLYEQSLALYRQLDDRPSIALVLRRLQNPVFFQRRDPQPATQLLEESLALSRQIGDMAGIAESLAGLGSLSRDQGEFAMAESLYEQARALFRQIGNQQGIAYTLSEMGYMLSLMEEYPRAKALLEENLALCRELKNKVTTAHGLWLLGRVEQAMKDYPCATALFAEGAVLARKTGARGQIANCLTNLGMVYEETGDLETARGHYEEAVAICREMGHRTGLLMPLWTAARVAMLQGDHAGARARFQEYLSILLDLGSKHGLPQTLEALAIVAALDRQPERAARLFGAAETLRKSFGENPAPLEPSTRDRAQRTAREALGMEAYDAADREGAQMSAEDAAMYALAAKG